MSWGRAVESLGSFCAERKRSLRTQVPDPLRPPLLAGSNFPGASNRPLQPQPRIRAQGEAGAGGRAGDDGERAAPRASEWCMLLFRRRRRRRPSRGMTSTLNIGPLPRHFRQLGRIPLLRLGLLLAGSSRHAPGLYCDHDMRPVLISRSLRLPTMFIGTPILYRCVPVPRAARRRRLLGPPRDAPARPPVDRRPTGPGGEETGAEAPRPGAAEERPKGARRPTLAARARRRAERAGSTRKKGEGRGGNDEREKRGARNVAPRDENGNVSRTVLRFNL